LNPKEESFSITVNGDEEQTNYVNSCMMPYYEDQYNKNIQYICSDEELKSLMPQKGFSSDYHDREADGSKEFCKYFMTKIEALKDTKPFASLVLKTLFSTLNEVYNPIDILIILVENKDHLNDLLAGNSDIQKKYKDMYVEKMMKKYEVSALSFFPLLNVLTDSSNSIWFDYIHNACLVLAFVLLFDIGFQIENRALSGKLGELREKEFSVYMPMYLGLFTIFTGMFAADGGAFKLE
jgi:hypothetical protein